MYLENWYLLRLTGRLLVLVWLAEWQFTVGHINQHWNEFFFFAVIIVTFRCSVTEVTGVTVLCQLLGCGC